jgi:hypothetical protein
LKALSQAELEDIERSRVVRVLLARSSQTPSAAAAQWWRIRK